MAAVMSCLELEGGGEGVRDKGGDIEAHERQDIGDYGVHEAVQDRLPERPEEGQAHADHGETDKTRDGGDEGQQRRIGGIELPNRCLFVLDFFPRLFRLKSDRLRSLDQVHDKPSSIFSRTPPSGISRIALSSIYHKGSEGNK
ncbi:MAG: hypothetical protein ABSC19_19190 [Syntrophorhabdales bacterium]|jgi:hypothetical protein